MCLSDKMVKGRSPVGHIRCPSSVNSDDVWTAQKTRSRVCGIDEVTTVFSSSDVCSEVIKFFVSA